MVIANGNGNLTSIFPYSQAIVANAAGEARPARAPHKRPNQKGRAENLVRRQAELRAMKDTAATFYRLCPSCNRPCKLSGIAGRYRCSWRCGAQLTHARWHVERVSDAEAWGAAQ